MKVIAQISSDTVLCEVTSGEIARLRGLSGRYDKSWSNSWITVGAEHDMKEAFEALDSLRRFDEAQFLNMQKRIKSMSDEFDEVKNVYEKLMLLDTIKEL